MSDFKAESILRIKQVSIKHIREQYEKVNWEARLIGLLGARGVGKTTLILQRLKKMNLSPDIGIYLSLDDLYFAENSLFEWAQEFVLQGGRHLFLDEVHKYSNWSHDIKKLYDLNPDLNIVFTGSSTLQLSKGAADLSRRAIYYFMQGLSLREYILLKSSTRFLKYNLNELVEHHIDIAGEIAKKVKPLKEFNEFLQVGYYPFYFEDKKTYYLRIEQVINLILEGDLQYQNFDAILSPYQLKKLLYAIATSAPFKPNINKLSERLNINRNALTRNIYYLEKAGLLNLLQKDNKGISLLQKPEKIFLENTNLMIAIGGEKSNLGNLRETFFFNQLSMHYQVNYSMKGDFVIENKVFEIGGKGKDQHQVKDEPNSLLALDNIEVGYGNKIPLWLFGFLY